MGVFDRAFNDCSTKPKVLDKNLVREFQYLRRKHVCNCALNSYKTRNDAVGQDDCISIGFTNALTMQEPVFSIFPIQSRRSFSNSTKWVHLSNRQTLGALRQDITLSIGMTREMVSLDGST